MSLNHWIESYAPDVHAQIADYYTALVDDKGMLREGYSDDGLHPNAKGYELLAPVAEAAIESALEVTGLRGARFPGGHLSKSRRDGL